MLASPLRALEPPQFWTYTIPMSVKQPRQDPTYIKIENGRFDYNPHVHMALTTLTLRQFYTTLPHTDFFRTLGMIPRLVALELEPANGVFAELDSLSPSYSLDLAPPHIPQYRGQRISLENLMSVWVGGKPSFCSAFMTECKILDNCSLAIDCKVCTMESVLDSFDEILAKLKDRIKATLAVEHDFDFDQDDVDSTEQTLEIEQDGISIVDDTRHAPVQCKTTTKLTIATQYIIDPPYVLPQVLQAFGAPARPCVVTLKAKEAVRGGQHWRVPLLKWLGGFDHCLHGIKFVHDRAFQFFAPLFTTVFRNGEVIGTNIVELQFQKIMFGVGTLNYATLLGVLNFREEKGRRLDQLCFEECVGVHQDHFPQVEVFTDTDTDSEAGKDEDEDMSYEDDEYDGNESDTTIGEGGGGVRRVGFDDEDDSMEVDE